MASAHGEHYRAHVCSSWSMRVGNPFGKRTLGWPYNTALTPLHLLQPPNLPPVEPNPMSERLQQTFCQAQQSLSHPKPLIVATRQISIKAAQCHNCGVAENNAMTHNSHSTKLVASLNVPAPCAGNQRCYKENTGSAHAFPFKTPNLVYTQNGTRENWFSIDLSSLAQSLV